ncbi:hypothetical protein [Haloarcula sebkhae]|uniref:Uncharacterized protein n=2 Tax=Haloarcula sebkhae TaxID=932660 RepID=A0ACC6VNC4_9EURY|nr:hypothetical protein [Haloarcula sebkhae]GGK83263.1 hypothetical protein GCM10009067_39370 [Haloarcula sebkhae]
MSANKPAENPIEQLTADEEVERIPHPESNQYAAAFRLDVQETAYKLVTHDGSAIQASWASAECSACNENEDYSPEMGTPSRTAQKRRKRANCEHAQFAADAFSLDSEGACGDCGAWAISQNALPHPTVSGAIALVEEYCAECGLLRAT